MNKIINSKYRLLAFSILCGIAYFALIMLLIISVEFSYLLGIFFFPAIVCGAAICIFTTIRKFLESREYEKAQRFFMIHMAVIVFAIIFSSIYFLI